jgi:haloacetate dehalogenase
MALDQLEVMRALSHDRFAVVAHDRGARVAHRLARDHPAAVEGVALHPLEAGHLLVEERRRETLAALREFLGPGHG